MGDFRKIFGKRKPPDAPPTINPADVINASTQANRYDINSPLGSRAWTQGADGRWTMTDAFNPEEQANLDLIRGNNIDVSNIAGSWNDNMAGVDPNAVYDQVNSPIGGPDFDAMMAQYGFGPNGGGGAMQGGANVPRVTTDLSGLDAVNSDYGAQSKEAQDAQYKQWEALANPNRERAQRSMEQRLANQGLVVGSEAYNDEMRRLNQEQLTEANDARYRAILTGNQRQNELFNQSLQRRQQGVSERFGVSDRDIAQRNADVSSATAMGTASIGANASGRNALLQALMSRYGADRNTELQRRGQLMSADTNRYNQFSSANALSRAGLNLPNFGPGGTIDVNGAYNIGNQSNQANYQGQLQGYNIRNQQDQQNAQAISAVLQAIFAGSDRRLKEDIEKVGKTDDGQQIYKYRYKGSPMYHMGVMADETKKRHPSAVVNIGGYDAVDYKQVT